MKKLLIILSVFVVTLFIGQTSNSVKASEVKLPTKVCFDLHEKGTCIQQSGGVLFRDKTSAFIWGMDIDDKSTYVQNNPDIIRIKKKVSKGEKVTNTSAVQINGKVVYYYAKARNYRDHQNPDKHFYTTIEEAFGEKKVTTSKSKNNSQIIVWLAITGGISLLSVTTLIMVNKFKKTNTK